MHDSGQRSGGGSCPRESWGCPSAAPMRHVQPTFPEAPVPHATGQYSASHTSKQVLPSAKWVLNIWYQFCTLVICKSVRRSGNKGLWRTHLLPHLQAGHICEGLQHRGTQQPLARRRACVVEHVEQALTGTMCTEVAGWEVIAPEQQVWTCHI